MPRKKDPSKQASRRSHHGCQRCRSQKIRCDEARPTCGPCKSRGLTDCTFSLVLKWETDYVGRAFGRAGVWSKTSGLSPGRRGSRTPDAERGSSPLGQHYGGNLTRVYPFGFLNTFIRDFQDEKDDFDDPPDNHTPGAGSIRFQQTHDQSLIPLRQPITNPLSISLHDVEPHLFSYFLHRICPLTVPATSYTTESPFSTLLLPFALSVSPALMQALLGLAASHRARFDESHQSVALSYSRQAISSLRSSLSAKSPSEISADPAILPLMMLLCQIELIRDGGSSWVVHLRGARDFIRFRRQHLALDTQSYVDYDQSESAVQMSKFAERFFAFYDVMGRTACSEEPIFGHDFWNNQEDHVDSWMGCSPQLVSIISTITELSWKLHGRMPSREERQDLEDQRLRLQDLLRQDRLMSNDTEQDDIILEECVELKRLTVELYLQAALTDATPSTATIQDSVRQILALIATLLDCGVKSGLTWPLFMAACQLDPVQELEWTTDTDSQGDVPHYARPFILYALDQLSDSLSNVSRTRSVIEQVWKHRESAQGVSDTSFNDWAHFVAPLCHNISLA